MAKPPTRFFALFSSFFFTRARLARKALRFSDPLNVRFIARLNKSATMILSFVHLLVVLGALRVQGRKMQSCFVFCTLIGDQAAGSE